VQAPRVRAEWAMIGLALRALAILLMRTGKKDRMLGRALKEFDGTYRFENGDGKAFRYLIFQKGKVKVYRNWPGPADFSFILYEPAAFYLRIKPEHILETVISGKIAQTGNTYYMYQFGFIMSLLQRYFQMKKLQKAKARAG